MQSTDKLKRGLLYALVGSVILAAVLGILLVLRNTWGWYEVRVILTTVIIAVASLCGLACDVSRTQRGKNILPITGLALTLLSACMILIAMWAEVESEAYWKATAAIATLAFATAHVSLLSIARLSRKFRWILPVAYQIIYGLALLIDVMIIFEIDEDQMFRMIAAISIIDAAVTLVIPILHRISRVDNPATGTMSLIDQKDIATIDQEILQLRKRLSELERMRAKLAGEATSVAPEAP